MKRSLRILVGTMAIAAMFLFSQTTSVHAQEYVQSDFWVSDSTDFNYHASQLSVSNAGDMVVVWETTGSGGGIWLKTITGLGTQLSQQKAVKSPFSFSTIRVAHADSGNFIVVYNGYTGGVWKVFGQTYDPEGNEIGDTITVSRSTPEMINIYWATISADSSGLFGVFLPGIDSMIVEKVTGEGTFVGNPVVLKPSHANFQNHTGLMTRSGQLILVWNSYVDGNIHGQRFTPEGVPIDTAFQVSFKEENSFIGDITLSSDTSGNFVVVWSTSRDSTTNMYSQLFTAEGIAIGSSTMITGGYHSFNGKMSVSMDQDGDFVVAWADTRNNDTSFIYLQQVDKLGKKVGDNYRATSINNHISPEQIKANQYHPDVRILRDTIYLAWVNYNQDIHYRQCIYASIQKWRVPATGINQHLGTPIETTIYPNPSAGIITLIVNHEYSGTVEVNVFNTNGSLVRRESRSWSGREITIDLSEVPAGMYYISIKGDSFHSTNPLVIVK